MLFYIDSDYNIWYNYLPLNGQVLKQSANSYLY